MQINFKDEQQLRALTRCLLKKDFQLDIELPPLQLVPTIPLRLNYIHWIEDLMSTFGIAKAVGVDIGCGASCIYPLLAARMNTAWHMYATETNERSLKLAEENIGRNELTERIQVAHDYNSNEPFTAIIENANWPTVDFTMCNPPFFDENAENEDDKHFKNRTGKRQQPNNVKTGISCEVMTPGGEVAFVKKMIQQSALLRTRVNIFTTMLGHKISLNQILDELKAQNICNVCTSEFCQGRTTRWGIAWTYRNDLLLRTAAVLGIPATKTPIIFSPSDIDDIDLATKKLLQILNTLVDDNSSGNCIENRMEYCIRFSAFTNTWTKQRRKRREQKRNEQEIHEGDEEPIAKRLKCGDDNSVEVEQKEQELTPVESEAEPPIIHIEFTIQSHKATDFKSYIFIELTYLNGTAGVNGLHELLQFIRNRWKMK